MVILKIMRFRVLGLVKDARIMELVLSLVTYEARPKLMVLTYLGNGSVVWFYFTYRTLVLYAYGG
jgi:hypothetical protein